MLALRTARHAAARAAAAAGSGVTSGSSSSSHVAAIAAAHPALLRFASSSAGRGGAGDRAAPWGGAQTQTRSSGTGRISHSERVFARSEPRPLSQPRRASDTGSRGGEGGSSGGGGGKRHYAPRSTGAQAARANPAPRANATEPPSPNQGRFAWSPVSSARPARGAPSAAANAAAAAAAAASASQPKPNGGWSRSRAGNASAAGGPAPFLRSSNPSTKPYHQQPHGRQPQTPVAVAVADAVPAASQAWARSAERRDRMRAGAGAPGNATDKPQRSGYRFGGERDSRSKIARPSSSVSGAASHLRSGAAHHQSHEDHQRSFRESQPRRTFEETAEWEEDVTEVIEPTTSAKEFWTHFPLAKQIEQPSAGQKRGGKQQQQQQQTPQRDQSTRPASAPAAAATPASSSRWGSESSAAPAQSQPQKKYVPVFINRPPPPQQQHQQNDATSAASAASQSYTAPPRPAAPAVEPARRGAERAELMGSSLPSIPIDRDNIRIGVLLPEPPAVNPAADEVATAVAAVATPSVAAAISAADERLRLQIEGLCQDVASRTGAALVTHPLHVDLCAQWVSMGSGLSPAAAAAAAAEEAEAARIQQAQSQKRKKRRGEVAEPTPDPAAAAAAAAAEAAAAAPMLPVLQLFESTVRHSGSSSRGLMAKAAGPPKGSSFYPSFYSYFSHVASRVNRNTAEAKLLARAALVRAVRWKPAEAETEAQFRAQEEEAAAAAAATAAAGSAPKKAAPTRMKLRDVNQLPQTLAGVTVLDATAGFAVDAFNLSVLGARVAAYENYPLFQVLLEQAQRMVRKEDAHMGFLQQRLSVHSEDSVAAMRKWIDLLDNQEQTSGATSEPVPIAAGNSGDDTVATPSDSAWAPPFPTRPQVVYMDPYASGGKVGGTSALPFHIQVRARYLKLLCGRPVPADLDTMLHVALRLAQSHVVVKFPRAGLHYRPGDVVDQADTGADAATAAHAWRVARIFRHHDSEFVVYVRADEADAGQAPQAEAVTDVESAAV